MKSTITIIKEEIYQFCQKLIKSFMRLYYWINQLVSKKSDQPMLPHFQSTSFLKLIKIDPSLVMLRKQYDSESEHQIRIAAHEEYEKAVQSPYFKEITKGILDDHPIPDILRVLAIDPNFPPALLTVGSLEYILGRVDEAMIIFLHLVTLAPEGNDLYYIIDRAGSFLIEQTDYSNGKLLYSQAIDNHPQIDIFYSGLSYCQGLAGNMDEAVRWAKKSVQLSPDNYIFINDLGYWLMAARRFKDAEIVLQQVITRFPGNSKRAKNNLKLLHSMINPSSEYLGDPDK